MSQVYVGKRRMGKSTWAAYMARAQANMVVAGSQTKTETPEVLALDPALFWNTRHLHMATII